MKVPQTGSFLNASALGMGRSLRGVAPLDCPVVAEGRNRSENPLRTAPRTARNKVMTNIAMTASRSTRIYFTALLLLGVCRLFCAWFCEIGLNGRAHRRQHGFSSLGVRPIRLK